MHITQKLPKALQLFSRLKKNPKLSGIFHSSYRMQDLLLFENKKVNHFSKTTQKMSSSCKKWHKQLQDLPSVQLQ